MKVGTDAVLLGAWAFSNGHDTTSIADIGTGSGVIALMLAQRFQRATIDAIEIDTGAATQAQENFNNSPWPDRLRSFNTDFKVFANEAQTKHLSYQLIVCNPPYFKSSLLGPDALRNQARHDLTLQFEDLLAGVSHLLTAGGHFCVILPNISAEEFTHLAMQYNLHLLKKTFVKGKPNLPAVRTLLAFHKGEIIAEAYSATDTLVIENEERLSYTSAYKALTKDFYIHF